MIAKHLCHYAVSLSPEKNMFTEALDESLINLGFSSHTEILRNVSYEVLFDAETDPALSGFEKGSITSSGAISIDTGEFTGRSPKDKYIVEEVAHKDNVWWASEGSDNKPISQEVFDKLKALSIRQLNGKRLYVMDGFCGANLKTRMKVRLVTEIAWQAHFFKNMFIRPTESELEDFEPDWTILNACKASAKNFQALGLNSETYVAFHLSEKMTVIGNTWYAGEMKKGIFSIMNYYLPLQGVGAFHCSANKGEHGDTAMFFGLSGTGKTTLSTDPKRALIGDDEHGWDDDGVFNFEGGCYAKTIKLSKDDEPEIYAAIKRDALVENVAIDVDGNIDYFDSSKTENTRVSYPIYHVNNIVKPVSRGAHPKHVVFLTCDAYGVLPPVSKLTREQAREQFLLGYTAKVAGTELGVTEPVAVFSPCFGAPFLLLHPKVYADVLLEKLEEHDAQAYLVNTGWMTGPYGVGSRISIKATRAIIDAVISGEAASAETKTIEPFGFEVPTQLTGVPSGLLMPRETWPNPNEYDVAAKDLKAKFDEKLAVLKKV